MRAACMQESSQLGVLQQVRFRNRLHLHLDDESERHGGSTCEGRAVVTLLILTKNTCKSQRNPAAAATAKCKSQRDPAAAATARR